MSGLHVDAQQRPHVGGEARPPVTEPLVERPRLPDRPSTFIEVRAYEKLSDAQLREFVAALVPLVERAVGRRFLEPPVVRSADDASWAALVAAEHPKATDPARQVATTFALYLPERDEIVISAFLASALGRDGDRGLLARAMLAHELAHVLQDQHFALPSRLRVESDPWARRVLHALAEGHALLVEERVATALGVEQVEKKLRRRLRGAATVPYLRGRDYLLRVEADGGPDALVRALTSKPPTPLEFARRSAPTKKKKRDR